MLWYSTPFSNDPLWLTLFVEGVNDRLLNRCQVSSVHFYCAFEEQEILIIYTVWMVIYWNSNVNILIFWDTYFWLSLAVSSNHQNENFWSVTLHVMNLKYEFHFLKWVKRENFSPYSIYLDIPVHSSPPIQRSLKFNGITFCMISLYLKIKASSKCNLTFALSLFLYQLYRSVCQSSILSLLCCSLSIYPSVALSLYLAFYFSTILSISLSFCCSVFIYHSMPVAVLYFALSLFYSVAVFLYHFIYCSICRSVILPVSNYCSDVLSITISLSL